MASITLDAWLVGLGTLDQFIESTVCNSVGSMSKVTLGQHHLSTLALRKTDTCIWAVLVISPPGMDWRTLSEQTWIPFIHWCSVIKWFWRRKVSISLYITTRGVVLHINKIPCCCVQSWQGGYYFFIYRFFFTSNTVKVHRALVFMHTHSLTHLLTY